MRIVAGLVMLAIAHPVCAAASTATSLCASIARHVDEAGADDPQAPVFLRSYEPGPKESALPPPLSTSAFSYDNALAIIALASCDDIKHAKRIADAFVAATHGDRTYGDGRIRNAYRAGSVKPGPVLLPGWWDSQHNVWAEDAYQDGTQTGNVAWVALALLNLDKAARHQATPSDSKYRDAAVTLAKWIEIHARDGSGPSGFSGGLAGFDHKQSSLKWQSTEHNVDVHALGAWLAQWQIPGSSDLATRSRGFLDAMYDVDDGHFRLGTTPDGAKQPGNKLALDALTWPLIGVEDPPSAWKQSLVYAEQHLSTNHGFDFDGQKDGLWTEGTAQASLVLRLVGQPDQARRLLSVAVAQTAGSGYLFATDGGTVSTGLKIGPQSTNNDFFYFYRPHLGATAWAAIAASGVNPFTGARVE